MVIVSVIIPTYKDDLRLNKCLEALNRQTLSKDLFEVIIVNNCVERDVRIEIHHSLNLSIKAESIKGSYAARNSGISCAKGKILGFTDSDCIPDPAWLENALKHFNKDECVMIIGGAIKLFYSDTKLSCAEIYEKAFAFRQDKNIKERGFAVTANMFTSKEVIEKIGVFNNMLYSSGDVEWGLRAQSAGFKILYSPDVIVNHPARSNIKDIIIKSKRIAGGQYILERGLIIKSLISFLLGFMPPVFKSAEVIKMNHLSLYEKIIAILVMYYLRIVKNIYRIGLYLGVNKIARS